jgi:hypothetical protein
MYTNQVKKVTNHIRLHFGPFAGGLLHFGSLCGSLLTGQEESKSTVKDLRYGAKIGFYNANCDMNQNQGYIKFT